MGMLREDVEDQRRAVDDAHSPAEGFFQFALVAGGKFIVEDDNFAEGFLGKGFEFLDFTGADIGFDMGAVKILGQLASHVDSGCIGKQGKFGERIFKGQDIFLIAKFDAD